MFLSCTLGHAQQANKVTPALPDAPKQTATETKNFFARWLDFYREDWSPPPTPASAPPPARRGLPSPLDSPPFPNADWSYGGSPTIGEPDTNSYPLMTAINGAKGRTKIYGWLDPTLNFSTSSNRNSPEANDLYSNRFELNQAVLYIERLPDSVQRDHIDLGFHLTALYGTDYRYTTDKGYFSRSLSDHRQYGFDPPSNTSTSTFRKSPRASISASAASSPSPASRPSSPPTTTSSPTPCSMPSIPSPTQES